MSDPLACSFAAAIALLSPLVAQQSPPRELVIPPGDYDFAELVAWHARHTGRATIEVPELRDDELRLQCPLRLDPQRSEMVLGRLAWARGLVLVPGDDGGRFVHLSGSDRGAIAAAAVELSPAELLREEGAVAWVRTRVAVKGTEPALVVTSLRAVVQSVLPARAVRMAPAEGAVEIEGFRHQVGNVLRILRAAYEVDLPDSGEPEPIRALLRGHAGDDGGSVKLEAGRHDLREVLDKVALLTGSNHLIDPGVTPATLALQLDEDVTIPAAEELRAVSALAESAGLVLLPVSVPDRLYEWIAARGPRRSDLITNASVVSEATASALAGIATTIVVAVPVRKENVQPVVAALRAGALDLLFARAGQDLLLVSGLATDVAEAIAIARRIDGR